MDSKIFRTSSLPAGIHYSDTEEKPVETLHGSIRQQDVKRRLKQGKPSENDLRMSRSLNQFAVGYAPALPMQQDGDTENVEQSLVFMTVRESLVEQALTELREPVDEEENDFFQDLALPAHLAKIDVEAALGPGFLGAAQQYRQQPAGDDTETSRAGITEESLISSTDEEDTDSDNDAFFSLDSLIPSLVQKKLVEDNLKARKQAWQALSVRIRKLHEQGSLHSQNWQDDANFNTALNKWLEQFPCVLNAQKIAAAIKQTSKTMTNPEDIERLFSGFMNSFQIAETLTPEDPEAVFKQVENDRDAILVLLIFRHKLVHDTPEDNYFDAVSKLDSLINEKLYQQFGAQLKARAGLDINTAEPDYLRFSRLMAIAGHATPVAGLDNCILAQAQDEPDSLLNTLITMDILLAEDGETPNMVIWSLGAALQKDFLAVAQKLGLTHFQDTAKPRDIEPAPAALQRPRLQKHAGQHVHFEDQEAVIPGDGARGSLPPELVEDVTPPARSDIASHMSVRYFSQLNEMLHTLQSEEMASNKENEEIQKAWQSDLDAIAAAQKDLDDYNKQADVMFFLPEKMREQMEGCQNTIQTHAKELVSKVDKQLERMYGEKGAALTISARERWIAGLSYVKAGLVNKEQFQQTYEQHLAKTLIKSLRPRLCKLNDTVMRDYTDVRDTPEDQGNYTREPRPSPSVYPPVPSYLKERGSLRGQPRTSDLMTGIGAHSRPYHQAMEVRLGSAEDFYTDLGMIDDPRVMLALRARMERSGAPQYFKDSWKQRMKEVMLDQCAQALLQGLDRSIGKRVKEKLGDECLLEAQTGQQFKDNERPREIPSAPPLTSGDEKIVQEVQKIVDAVFDKYLKILRQGQINSEFIEDNFVNHAGLAQVYAGGLVKPDRWPKKVNDMIRNFLPTGPELADYLQGNYMTPTPSV